MNATTGTVFEVKRFAIHDGPGIRTALFLKGCPLRCLWCHNPEGMKSEPELAFFEHKCLNCGNCAKVCPNHAHKIVDGKHVFDRTLCTLCGQCVARCFGKALTRYGQPMRVEEARKIVLEDAIFYEPEGGVTLSGGEPMMQHEFCFQLFSALKKDRIHTALDTCLFASQEQFEKILPVTDIFLVDVKQSNDREHRRLTGQSNVRIFENLSFLSSSGAQIEIRIPFVPGCNDSDEDMHLIGKRLQGLHLGKVKLLPYHAFASSKYLALGLQNTLPKVETPSEERITHAAAILRTYGLNALSGNL